MAITNEEQRKRFITNGWVPLPPDDDSIWRRGDHEVYLHPDGTVGLYRACEGEVSLSIALEVASILGTSPSSSSEGVMLTKEQAQRIIDAAHGDSGEGIWDVLQPVIDGLDALSTPTNTEQEGR